MSYLISDEGECSDECNDECSDECNLQDLSDELNHTKSKIDNYIKEWSVIKKQIHDCEYIYYSSYRKKNISAIIPTPVSRSYFKFREMFYKYSIRFKNDSKICNLAEAPGGFIQSINHLLPDDLSVKIYANTLVSDKYNVPTWNSYLKKNRLHYVYGKNNDGDLCNFKNLLSMIKQVGKSSCDLITGDGGFDYSGDYSGQESDSLRLIYSEIFMALNIQKKGGTFICKIFDTFMKETIDLLYYLTLCYEKVYLYKPKISRNSNSEKYIVCLNFKGYDHELMNQLCHSYATLKLESSRSKAFDYKIKEYIHEYTLQQIKSIDKGIYMIENSMSSNYPSREQIRMAINWCKEHDIKINTECLYLNNSDRTR